MAAWRAWSGIGLTGWIRWSGVEGVEWKDPFVLAAPVSTHSTHFSLSPTRMPGPLLDQSMFVLIEGAGMDFCVHRSCGPLEGYGEQWGGAMTAKSETSAV